MIYVPNLEDYVCFVVRDSETIRAYKTIPMQGENVSYRDYYYNSNYLYQDGVQQFSVYSTIPICLDSSVLTNDYYYRNDIADILIIFIILAFVIIYCPIKIVMRLFKKR